MFSIEKKIAVHQQIFVVGFVSFLKERGARRGGDTRCSKKRSDNGKRTATKETRWETKQKLRNETDSASLMPKRMQVLKFTTTEDKSH